MSVLTELLDRLSGVAVVREKLAETVRRVEMLGERYNEFDRRLTRIETMVELAQRHRPAPAPGKLPRK